MTFKKNIIIGLIVLSIGVVGCSNNSEPKEELSTVDKKQTNNEVVENKSEEIELPEYKVELVDNSNIGDIIRETIHIVVPGEYTLDQLEAIAKKEAISYTDKNKVNALTVGFYRDKENIGRGYDMGRVEYVPNGKFEDATTIKSGEYSSFEFVNHLNEHIELPKGEDISSTNGDTNLETVKSDILDVESSSIVDISKDGDTLVIKIKEQEDHPIVSADENAIATYTDWCLENIKSDILKLDISLERPSSSVRAILDMNKMETSNGRYFDTIYISENIK